MVKKVTIVVSLLVVLVVGAFAMAESPTYLDGVYTGRGEGYNDYIEVEVVVKDGLIEELNVLYCEDTPGVWDLAVNMLTGTMLETQDIEVDVISQATYSSEGFIDAVQDALSGATFATVENAEYLDGVYTGRGEGYNDYIEVEVVVKDGLIAELNVLYCEDTPGVWDLAVNMLTGTMLETQDIEVDVISQATYSSEGFIDAVKNALQEAN